MRLGKASRRERKVYHILFMFFLLLTGKKVNNAEKAGSIHRDAIKKSFKHLLTKSSSTREGI